MHRSVYLLGPTNRSLSMSTNIPPLHQLIPRTWHHLRIMPQFDCHLSWVCMLLLVLSVDVLLIHTALWQPLCCGCVTLGPTSAAVVQLFLESHDVAVCSSCTFHLQVAAHRLPSCVCSLLAGARYQASPSGMGQADHKQAPLQPIAA